MTVENISWSISTKECCRPRRGLNPRPPGLQLDGASNWAIEAGKRSPFTDQIRPYIKNRSILGIQAKEIFNEICCFYGNKKLFFSSVTRWCKKLKSGVVTFSYSRGSKTPRWKKNIKRAKISVWLFFSVWTIYLEKIMKTHLKIGLKDWNFVYHMVERLKLCVSHGGEYFEGLR